MLVRHLTQDCFFCCMAQVLHRNCVNIRRPIVLLDEHFVLQMADLHPNDLLEAP